MTDDYMKQIMKETTYTISFLVRSGVLSAAISTINIAKLQGYEIVANVYAEDQFLIIADLRIQALI